MLKLTMKKSEPLVLHVSGIPIARIVIPENARHSQILIGLMAKKSVGIDRESIFKKNYPDIDPVVYLSKLEQAA